MRDGMRRRSSAPRCSLLAIALAPVLLSCSSVLTDIQVAPIVSVRVSPDSVDLPIGRTTPLQAFPLDSTGAYRPIGVSGWASSDPAIATVDEAGVVTGIAAGSTTITATARDIRGTARVRVGPAPMIVLAVDSIRIDATVGQGDPPAQVVAVGNGGGLALSGLAAGPVDYGSGPSAWLVAQFDTTVAPAALTVQALTGAITQAGTWLATVPVTAPLAGNSPRTLRVVLVLAAP
jgi:hypothetical protein